MLTDTMVRGMALSAEGQLSSARCSDSSDVATLSSDILCAAAPHWVQGCQAPHPHLHAKFHVCPRGGDLLPLPAIGNRGTLGVL